MQHPTPPTVSSTDTRVVIDWTKVIPSHQIAQTNTHIDLLLNWVRSYPSRSHVHVVLRRSLLADVQARKLQSTLQALGCTVTTRSSFTR